MKHTTSRPPLTPSLALVVCVAAVAAAEDANLTGLWQDENGVVYQVRQLGDKLYWRADNRPDTLSVFHGRIEGNTVMGLWADLPSAQRLSNGTLTLRIESADRLTLVEQSSPYGVVTWTRQGGAGQIVPPTGGDGGDAGTTPPRPPVADSPSQPSPHGGPPIPAVSTGTGTLSAAEGGTLSTQDGTVSLVVPPGALERDTEITVQALIHPTHPDNPGLVDVAFRPSGLEFTRPATLSVRFPGTVDDSDALTVVQFSEANESVPCGAEGCRYRWLREAKLAADGRSVEVPLQHFSWVRFLREKWVYLVFDYTEPLMARYIKKSDILYTLTCFREGLGATWWPGHAGLYLGTEKAASDENDGVTIVESTMKDVEGGYKHDGVQFSTLNRFCNYRAQHVFMGLRRPLFPVTDDERSAVASWAVSRIGTPYAIIGGPLGNIDGIGTSGRGINCVGLVERAYENGTGKQITPTLARLIAVTPLRQFCRTLPVNEVKIPHDKWFRLYIKGVVRKLNTGLSALKDQLLSGGDVPSYGYYDHPENCRVTMETEPDSPARAALDGGRAKFDAHERKLTFRPNDDDAGYIHEFIFTVDAGFKGKVRKPFFIEVEPKPIERTLPPALSAKGLVTYPANDRHPSDNLEGPAKDGKYELSLVIVDLKPGGEIQGKSIVTAEDPIKEQWMKEGGGWKYPVTGTRKTTYEYRWKGTIKGTEPQRQRFYADDLTYQIRKIMRITPAEGFKRERFRDPDSDRITKPWGDDGKKRNWRFQLSGNLAEKDPKRQLIIRGAASAPMPINWQRDPLIIGAE